MISLDVHQQDREQLGLAEVGAIRGLSTQMRLSGSPQAVLGEIVAHPQRHPGAVVNSINCDRHVRFGETISSWQARC